MEGQRRYRTANREEHNRRKRESYETNRDGEIRRCRERRTTLHGKAVSLLRGARSRAEAKGLSFDLTAEWMEAELEKAAANGCPYLGIPIRLDIGGAHCPNSPSIDRIDSTRGYMQDNCIVASFRANSLKSDASLDELEKLYLNVTALTLLRVPAG